jgi:hypothetical protein
MSHARILATEDENIIAMSWASRLTSLGYDVLRAASAGWDGHFSGIALSGGHFTPGTGA